MLRLLAPQSVFLEVQTVKLEILSSSTLSLQTLNLALFTDRQRLLQVGLTDSLLGNFGCFQHIQGMKMASLAFSLIPNFDGDAWVDF